MTYFRICLSCFLRRFRLFKKDLTATLFSLSCFRGVNKDSAVTWRMEIKLLNGDVCEFPRFWGGVIAPRIRCYGNASTRKPNKQNTGFQRDQHYGELVDNSRD